MSHTPTPYRMTARRPGDKVIRIEGPVTNDYFINLYCEVSCDDRDTDVALANAEFIVKACNSHDALVGALRKALENLEEVPGRERQWACEAVEAALALAEAKP